MAALSSIRHENRVLQLLIESFATDTFDEDNKDSDINDQSSLGTRSSHSSIIARRRNYARSRGSTGGSIDSNASPTNTESLADTGLTEISVEDHGNEPVDHAELPPGWQSAQTEDGTWYYFKEGRESQWHVPTEE